MLLAEGNEAPTNDDIHAKLGGISIADISPVMREWRESHKEQTSIRLSIPQAVSEVGQRFVAQLWASADTEASKAVEGTQVEAHRRISAVETERDEALAEFTRLEQETACLRQEIEAQQREAKDQAAKVEALTKERRAQAGAGARKSPCQR